MSTYAIEDTDLSAMLTKAIHNVTCGIAPHRGKRESEEYSVNVPIWLRDKRGLPADELADALARVHPELGIESEDDLLQALAGAARQRRNGGKGGYQMQEPTVEDKEQAIRQFAAALGKVDPAALAQVREAWRLANKHCGHKLLAPVLLGDMERTLAKLDKLAVN